MYIDENDNRTPRERVDDSVLRRMLEGDSAMRNRRGLAEQRGLSCNPDGGMTDNDWLAHVSLGMVYSPMQAWRALYDVETALDRGTLFRELDMPWEVPMPSKEKGGCCCE